MAHCSQQAAQGNGSDVISGRASLEQDLLGGVMTVTGAKTAVASGDLKRDHGAAIMVHA